MSPRKQVNAARQSGRTPRKARLGQNFLTDGSAVRRIIEALGDISNSVVVEIGPGGGALTHALAENAEHVIAIELDEMLAQQLRAAFAEHSNVEIVQENFLSVELSELLNAHRQLSQTRADVVGNIPYYITSDILLRIFEQHEFVKTVVIMVQKEVADRLVAEPGSRDYGLLTVTAQLFTEVERLFTLPPGAFSPPPQVYSSVLRLRVTPKSTALQVDADDFLNFCKLAFAQKRKTLFNNLRGRYEEQKVRAAIKKADAREDVRAEALSLRELAEVFRNLGWNTQR